MRSIYLDISYLTLVRQVVASICFSQISTLNSKYKHTVGERMWNPNFDFGLPKMSASAKAHWMQWPQKGLCDKSLAGSGAIDSSDCMSMYKSIFDVLDFNKSVLSFDIGFGVPQLSFPYKRFFGMLQFPLKLVLKLHRLPWEYMEKNIVQHCIQTAWQSVATALEKLWITVMAIILLQHIIYN